MRRWLACAFLASTAACVPGRVDVAPVRRELRPADLGALPIRPEIGARGAAAREDPCPAPAGTDGPLVLAFAGDVIAHEGIRAAAARAAARDADGSTTNHGGYDALLGGAKGALRDVDLAFANLESPITELHRRLGPMIFHGEDALVGALAGAGFGVVSLANNHAYDQGAPGLRDTLAAVARHGLVATGAGATAAEACKPRTFDRKGIRVALFARTQFMNFPDDSPAPRVCMLDLGLLKRDVSAARRSADLVVVSLHWGAEYDAAPRSAQVDVARMIVDAGADVLIGHHPHVLQRVDRIKTHGRDAIVAYSIGNLLSNQAHDFVPDASRPRRGDPRDAAVLRIAVEKAPAGDGARAPVRFRDVSAVPLWTEHRDGVITLEPATARRARIGERLGVPLVDAPDAPRTCAR